MTFNSEALLILCNLVLFISGRCFVSPHVPLWDNNGSIIHIACNLTSDLHIVFYNRPKSSVRSESIHLLLFEGDIKLAYKGLHFYDHHFVNGTDIVKKTYLMQREKKIVFFI